MRGLLSCLAAAASVGWTLAAVPPPPGGDDNIASTLYTDLVEVRDTICD